MQSKSVMRASGIIVFGAAGAFAAACGTIAGIGDLDVAPQDGGAAETSVPDSPHVDAPSESSSADVVVPPDPPKRPAAGVYTYSIKGMERLSGSVAYSTSYGPTATIQVVRTTPACFQQTMTLRKNYDEMMNECVVGFELVMDSGTRVQGFPFVGNVASTLTCAPGDAYLSTVAEVGKTWEHTCTGKNTDDKSGDSAFTTAGSYRFEGTERMAVLGVDTTVLHYHDNRMVTGQQKGSNVADWYLSAVDGRVVRFVRTIAIEYGSIIGTVYYNESVDMTLTGFAPEASDGGADAN